MLALGEYVIVRPTATKTRTDGGIIIPDSAQAKSGTGEVISVGHEVYLFGPDREIGTPSQAIGRTVLFARHQGVTVEVGGESYLALKDTEVLAIL